MYLIAYLERCEFNILVEGSLLSFKILIFLHPNNTTLIIKTQTLQHEYSHQVLRVVATAYFSEESDV